MLSVSAGFADQNFHVCRLMAVNGAKDLQIVWLRLENAVFLGFGDDKHTRTNPHTLAREQTR